MSTDTNTPRTDNMTYTSVGKKVCPADMVKVMETELQAAQAEVARLKEVAGWAQAVLTGLNVGNICSGSLLHEKLREVMIKYRRESTQ